MAEHVLDVGQGNFSHSLAEYTLAACNWFAKDFPRLRAQQKARQWKPFDVEELRCWSNPPALAPITHSVGCIARLITRIHAILVKVQAWRKC